MAYVVAIVGLGLLIVLHEAGHFIVARLCGMRVERFSIGFGPTLVGFKRGETTYQIAPLLLGGFVQITGLNPAEDFDRNDPRVYPNRPRWMQLLTLLAGPAANYAAAFVVMLIVFAGFGVSVPSSAQEVAEPVPGKPAARVGMLAGDVLVEANGQAVSMDNPIGAVIRASGGKPVTIKVLRDGAPRTFAVTPEPTPSGEYLVGIRVQQVVTRQDLGLARAAAAAAAYPIEMSASILRQIGQMILGKVEGDLTGPVGITKQIAHAAERGVMYFLEIIAILSVYLGLVNLLPLPALDGGRAAFLAAGSLFRRRINPLVEAHVHMVGFVLLMGLLLVVTFKDIFGRG